MFALEFIPLATEAVRRLQEGGSDANHQPPERHVSDGVGVPCRHCLKGVEKGEEYLLLAHRPFSRLQPYAELGPIFLHHAPCEAYRGSEAPPMLAREEYLLRGYDTRERIVYGTGRIVKTARLREEACALLENPGVAFLHVRSATNNCFQCRIDRQ